MRDPDARERAGAPPRTTHVFIVGLPRTGSTLTRGMLNASPMIWIAGESHFLPWPTRLGLWRNPGYASRLRRIGDLRTEAGLDRIVEHLFSLRGKSFWARLASRTDASSFAARLRATDRSDRALLDAAMSVFAGERPIRGEKTPEHVHAVPTLLEWFPGARVIHTFRDPRAVYVSLRRKERSDRLTLAGRAARRLGPVFEVYAVLNVVLSWRRMLRLHHAYARRYPDRYRLVRFEDLVTEPERTTRGLARFLGIDHTDAMLEQVVHNSSYLGKGTATGIDPSVVDRWREHLSPTARRLFALAAGRALARLGYGD